MGGIALALKKSLDDQTVVLGDGGGWEINKIYYIRPST
jgi:hypothetical protein